MTKFIFTAALLWGVSVSAGAEVSPTADLVKKQTPPPEKVWSLQDCLDYAHQNSTQVRTNLIAILEADQDIASNKDAWLPTVGFNTNQSVTNYPSPIDGSNGTSYGSNYGVSANWTVWDGNIRKYRIENARLLRERTALEGESVIKELDLQILSAYLNILYSQEALEIAEKTLEVSTTQTERAKRLMESGRSSKVDYAQIESQRAQDAYAVTQAQANLASSRLTLKKILQLGIEDKMEIASSDFTNYYIFATIPSSIETFDLACAWIPDLRSNDIGAEMADLEVKIAKAGLLPTVNLQGGINTGYATGNGATGWGYQMGHNFNENLGLTLSVPIFDGNSSKRSQAKAKLGRLDAEVNREALLSDLSQTIEGLYIDSSNSRARYEAAIPRMEAAELTNTLVNRQFELGAVNPLELLTAHNNLQTARLEVIQNKYLAILADKTILYYATRQITLP